MNTLKHAAALMSGLFLIGTSAVNREHTRLFVKDIKENWRNPDYNGHYVGLLLANQMAGATMMSYLGIVSGNAARTALIARGVRMPGAIGALAAGAGIGLALVGGREVAGITQETMYRQHAALAVESFTLPMALVTMWPVVLSPPWYALIYSGCLTGLGVIAAKYDVDPLVWTQSAFVHEYIMINYPDDDEDEHAC